MAPSQKRLAAHEEARGQPHFGARYQDYQRGGRCRL